MKTIEVSDEMYVFLLNLSKELNTQDNRATADPYYYTIKKTVVQIVPDGYEDKSVWIDNEGGEIDDIKEYIIENIFSDYETREEAEETYNELKDYEIEELLEDNDCRYIHIKEVHEYNNFFFTEKACEQHISSNKHHYNNPVSYVEYAFRNPELEMVVKFLKSIGK